VSMNYCPLKTAEAVLGWARAWGVIDRWCWVVIHADLTLQRRVKGRTSEDPNSAACFSLILQVWGSTAGQEQKANGEYTHTHSLGFNTFVGTLRRRNDFCFTAQNLYSVSKQSLCLRTFSKIKTLHNLVWY